MYFLIIFLINLLSWTIRGLGNPIKLCEIESLINHRRLSWVGCIETKLLDCNIHTIIHKWEFPKIGFVACNVVSSHSGGLISMWKNDSFDVKAHYNGTR